MSEHALYSPSSHERWGNCPGSIAVHKNTSSRYAEEGTAAHSLAAECLTLKRDAVEYLGEKFGDFTVDDDFAAAVQVYLNEIRALAKNGTLLVEVQVDLAEAFGVEKQFGTSDAVVVNDLGTHVDVADLKFGMGERVFAEKNLQMMDYALGTLDTLKFAGYDLSKLENVTLHIIQPRIDHLDSWTLSIADLDAHRAKTRKQIASCQNALMLEVGTPAFESTIVPGEKQCRWCSYKPYCKPLARSISQAVFDDFDAIDDPATLAKADPGLPPAHIIGQRLSILDLVDGWMRAVRAEGERLVLSGAAVIGMDGLAFKVVEGKRGNKKWADEKKAEEALVGVLAVDKAYKPQEIISPAVAGKILNKKATKDTWAAMFEPLITQAPGKPSVVPGSDPRPPYQGAATADDFDTEE